MSHKFFSSFFLSLIDQLIGCAETAETFLFSWTSTLIARCLPLDRNHWKVTRNAMCYIDVEV